MSNRLDSLHAKRAFLRSAVVLGLLGVLLLSGCHTTAGFGQDLQSVGRNVQNSANKSNR